MSTVDKVAIMWTIAIVFGGVALALAGSSLQDNTPVDNTGADRILVLNDSRAGEDMMTDEVMKADEDMMTDEVMKADEDMMTDEVMKKDTTPQRVLISIPNGAGLPDCVKNDECYSPSSAQINAGDTVTWTNDDIAVHTVTAGNLQEDPSLVGETYPNGWDSSIFASGTTFSQLFANIGTYDYYCQVHPWMVGNITVI